MRVLPGTLAGLDKSIQRRIVCDCLCAGKIPKARCC